MDEETLAYLMELRDLCRRRAKILDDFFQVQSEIVALVVPKKEGDMDGEG